MLSEHGWLSGSPEVVQSKGHHVSPSTRPTELQYSVSSKSWQRAAGPGPIVHGFFFADLFVPSSILLPRLEIPYMLSSKECSSCWPESQPGNEEQLCICGFFSLVASSLTAVRQTVLVPELFTSLIQRESNHCQVTSSREPLLTSTSSLVPDL